MNDRYIHWVVALQPEAEPIIKSLGLKLVSNGKSEYPVWESASNTDGDIRHRLVLSGIGKLNAAAAVAWLQCSAPEPRASTAWINFGIAGHQSRELGTVVRANRVTDASSGKSWYPATVWKRKADIDSTPLRTIDTPSSEYPDEDCIIDMEASGFFSTAIRFTSLELIQSIKVISDNADNDFGEITKDSVRAMCEAAFTEIAPWLAAYVDITKTEASRVENPLLLDALVGSFRFSQTQTHQLRRLLTRHTALGTQLSLSKFEGLKTGREVIRALTVESH